jgi:glycolate oxidase FAD binding subunit
LTDRTAQLREAVLDAASEHTALDIVGAGTKRFLGRAPVGVSLGVAGHRGIVCYEPTELVVTARAGTPLAEVEATLDEHGQMLAFEPPRFAAGGTLGGAIACGLSGPRRPYAGAARDFTLGVKLLDAKGRVLSFGGQVMKNVAGYDLSRLMVGAFGTLGLLLEVSLKVLPRPAFESTRCLHCDAEDALARMIAWSGTSLPVSAASFTRGLLYARLSGTRRGVEAAAEQLGGEPCDGAVWDRLRDHTHPAFEGPAPLWRLSVPATAPLPTQGDLRALGWAGAERWVAGDEAIGSSLREDAARVGGHASAFRNGDRAQEVFQPLPAPLMRLHQRLKAAFDPERIFNPGRLYADL